MNTTLMSRRNNLVMAVLITLPLALAAMMWCILPSGYRACRTSQQREISAGSHWRPLQPALHQAIEFIKQ